jgi:nucleotide-binding universal stress UspA family protein
MPRIQTILVGTDGSETATRAVARAAELAAEAGAVLHIVTAYKAYSVQKLEARRASLPEEFRWSVSADREARDTLRHAAEHASRMGVKVETHLATGDPAKVILKTAQDLGADVVVVGNKWIERRIRGSVPGGVPHLGADVVVVGNKWIERRIRGSVPGGVSKGADRDVMIVDTTSASLAGARG